MYELICEESIRYAVSYERHDFKRHIDEAKIFVSLLLRSGYVSLPRRRMYWEAVDDAQNILVRNIMSTNKFNSIMQNLLLTNTNNFNASDNC